MDKFLQNFLFSITIAIPAITGLFRYKEINAQYRPFIWICCLITLNEVFMFILIRQHIYTFISYNIAAPLTCLLYLTLFKRWGLFAGRQYWFIILFSALILVWVADHFLISGYKLNARTHYFRVFFSMTLVLLSVHTINRLIVTEKRNLARNSRFLICISLVIYYTYRILVDAFSIKGMSQDFLMQLGDFNRYLLISLNLIFALATLWIPAKKNYTIQF